jgi:hypothetical protein
MLLIGETSAPPSSGAFFWGTIANEPRQGTVRARANDVPGVGTSTKL